MRRLLRDRVLAVVDRTPAEPTEVLEDALGREDAKLLGGHLIARRVAGEVGGEEEVGLHASLSSTTARHSRSFHCFGSIASGVQIARSSLTLAEDWYLPVFS